LAKCSSSNCSSCDAKNVCNSNTCDTTCDTTCETSSSDCSDESEKSCSPILQ
jgi:hypothetical protein